jgi:cytidyltransferase-like protein
MISTSSNDTFTMIIRNSLCRVSSLASPYALTIGSFDGMHLGHQYLLKTLKQKGTAAVVTFSNHPSLVLKERTPLCLITPLEQKIALLEGSGVDLLYLLPFSLEFAEQPFDLFLEKIQQVYPFSFLCLGIGAAFGKRRQGDAAHVQELAKKMEFTVEYLPKLKIHDEEVSSGRIRKLIEKGTLEKASQLLGRPYSLLLFWDQEPIHVEHLCLLPAKKYTLSCRQNEHTYLAHGYLSHTPPLLNIQFPNERKPDPGWIEVIFEDQKS